MRGHQLKPLHHSDVACNIQFRQVIIYRTDSAPETTVEALIS